VSFLEYFSLLGTDDLQAGRRNLLSHLEDSLETFAATTL
jgi:hypothetical protein